jgi:hypothetical protein
VVRLPQKPQPGKLRTTAGGLQHTVFNAETGEKVDDLSRVRTEITLPAGIYEVQFGPGRWKGVEVRSGETTTIDPGVLRLEHRIGQVIVVDSETGERFGDMDAANSEVVLMPGLYDLRYGKQAQWRFVKVDGKRCSTRRASPSTPPSNGRSGRASSRAMAARSGASTR